MKKFNMEMYIKRRIQQLRGRRPFDVAEDGITQYTQQRIRELAQHSECERALDKSVLGCYTLRTMEVDDGNS